MSHTIDTEAAALLVISLPLAILFSWLFVRAIGNQSGTVGPLSVMNVLVTFTFTLPLPLKDEIPEFLQSHTYTPILIAILLPALFPLGVGILYGTLMLILKFTPFK